MLSKVISPFDLSFGFVSKLEAFRNVWWKLLNIFKEVIINNIHRKYIHLYQFNNSLSSNFLCKLIFLQKHINIFSIVFFCKISENSVHCLKSRRILTLASPKFPNNTFPKDNTGFKLDPNFLLPWIQQDQRVFLSCAKL